MRQIPYPDPNRSKFYKIIKDYILNLDNAKQDGIDIKIELPESEPDGYRGEYTVKIDSVQPFFETDFKVFETGISNPEIFDEKFYKNFRNKK